MFIQVGDTVPARVALAFTENRMQITLGTIARACMQVQGRYQHLSVIERTAKAHQLVLDDYQMNRDVLGDDSSLDEYLKQTFVPALIQSTVKGFNDAGWFPSEKVITFGGENNPNQTPARSSVPTAPPRPEA